MKRVSDPSLKAEYRSRLAAVWKKRREPAALLIYILKCAIHYHYLKIADSLEKDELRIVNSF
jgi:hypothetical protein